MEEKIDIYKLQVWTPIVSLLKTWLIERKRRKQLSARSYQRLHTISSSIPQTLLPFLFYLSRVCGDEIVGQGMQVEPQLAKIETE